MYTLFFVILIAIAAGFIFYGRRKRQTPLLVIGIGIGAFTLFLFWFMDFWGEALWFDAVGYAQRFWTVVWAKIWLMIAGAVLGGLLILLFTWLIPRERRAVKLIAAGLGAFVGGSWGLANWQTILRYLNRVNTAVEDPILHQDIGFYFFELPLYDALYQLLFWLAVLALGSVLLSLFLKISLQQEKIGVRSEEESVQQPERRFSTIAISAAILVFITAWGLYLQRFHLMYSTLGAVTGAGWTDDHIRIPAYLIVSILTAVFGVLLAVAPLRKKVFQKFKVHSITAQLISLGVLAACIIGFWFVSLSVLPGLFQWLRVEPNEISFEEPYIANNIEFTRRGFKLHKIEEREFPVSQDFTQEMVKNNEEIFSNIRLWDWRALQEVYQQFQEIRLYYEFVGVDIDRYTIDGDYRQVMVSARELDLSNLPEQSQTFVNRRFKYTHGYGITLTTVNEFTPQGLPHLLIKDIPPKHEYPTLKVEQPQIYYGELTNSHVVVNSSEQEFDYPSGEENMYIRYDGTGGVQLSNLWRKFLFGWKFDGTRFFLSGYPTAESRLMFHRNIKDRVQRLAPFLELDEDPYIVLVDGKLYWILDAYTTSEYYPYSDPFSSVVWQRDIRRSPYNPTESAQTVGLGEVNYLRNSVKVVIDAFHGTTDFYVFDEEDPLIQVWRNIFPNVFQARDAMPEGLLQHIRYPEKMLLAQGLVYTKYHMTDPTVFYNQEDLWIRATEKYHNQVQPVDPYYILWEPPESDKPEFVLMQPFTPKKRQVLIGWIAGMSDPGNYGRLLAYKFPKEKRVLGTQQVETKIDQDSHLSGQLTLWDQRGSNVIRGNVLVIPIDETLLYVEPIYLQSDTAAYPELRLVAVMHDDQLSYAKTFDEALQGLFGEAPPELAAEEGLTGERSAQALIGDADAAFNDYLNALGAKRFDAASDALRSLEQALQRLQSQTGAEAAGEQPK
jgi:uncharacterized protein